MVGSGGLLSLGGGAIIVGGVIAGTAEITYGGTVVAAASGNLGDDLDRLFRAIKSKGASGTNSFDLNNIDSFENAKITDVEKYLDNTLKGYTKAPLKRGTGVRYFDSKGNSYQLNYGYENASDLIHGGPYLKTTQGNKIVRIQLTK